MNYVNFKTKEPLTIQQVRTLYPSMSIPDGADLSHLGLAFLFEDKQPIALPNRRIISGPIVQRDGVWYSTWIESEADIVFGPASVEQQRTNQTDS